MNNMTFVSGGAFLLGSERRAKAAENITFNKTLLLSKEYKEEILLFFVCN